MKKIVLSILIGIFFFSNASFAQQPIMVEGENIIQIEEEQISKAYYGELETQEEYFQITSDEKFSLYVKLKLPSISGISKDINVEIIKIDDGKEILVKTLEGNDYDWTTSYESFSADNYLDGPVFHNPSAEPGSYLIKVYNEKNTGKYILVTGKTDEFPLTEIINTIKVLPQVKVFLDKSPYTAYFNLAGAIILLPFLVVLLLIKIIRFFVRRT